MASLRRNQEYTRTRKARLSEVPLHRRVLTVRGAYRLAYKRSLTLGGLALVAWAGSPLLLCKSPADRRILWVLTGAWQAERCKLHSLGRQLTGGLRRKPRQGVWSAW